MALMIVAEECTSCGDCEPVCPTGAVVKKNGLYSIKEATCNECEDYDGEHQCVMACEVDDCIVPLAA